MKHEQYGLAAYLSGMAAPERGLGHLNKWIMPAILHDQVMFAFDRSGKPLAYWTWAYLSADVEDRLRRHPHAQLHESEWNEGASLWIMEFVAPNGYVSDIAAFIRMTYSVREVTVRRGLAGRDKYRTRTWKCRPHDDYDGMVERSLVVRLARSSFARSHSEWLSNEGREPQTF